MHASNDDYGKRRLVDRDEIRVAVRLLLQHGYDDSDIAPKLSRHYYVDIDALNEELAALMSEALAAHHADMRQVA